MIRSLGGGASLAGGEELGPVPTVPPRRIRTARLVTLVILSIVALWLVLVGLLIRGAVTHVRAGLAAVTAAQAGIQPATITNGDAAGLL
ncbi:MAG TPA: hypothetical protein VMW49_09345, partial [Candidatus Dormibacteraeota bacterium]|nr:hypothetical protein [Candidatus Dormibacteraeota bacterium]